MKNLFEATMVEEVQGRLAQMRPERAAVGQDDPGTSGRTLLGGYGMGVRR
jgi:hypothetical protein